MLWSYNTFAQFWWKSKNYIYIYICIHEASLYAYINDIYTLFKTVLLQGEWSGSPKCWEPLKTQATHLLIRFLVLAEAWSWTHWNQKQNSQWVPKYSIRPALQRRLKYLRKLCWSGKKEWQAICVGANFQVNSTVTGKSTVSVQKRENAGFNPACKCVGPHSDFGRDLLRVKVCIWVLFWMGTNYCWFKPQEMATGTRA